MSQSSRNLGFLSMSSAFHMMLIAGVLAINLQNPSETKNSELVDLTVFSINSSENDSNLLSDKVAENSERIGTPLSADKLEIPATPKESPQVLTKSDTGPVTHSQLPAPQKEISAKEVAPVLGNDHALLSVANINAEEVDTALIDSVVDEIPADDSGDPIAKSLNDLQETTDHQAAQSEQLAESLFDENIKSQQALAAEDSLRQAEERKKVAQVIAAQRFNEQQAGQKSREQESAQRLSESSGSAAGSDSASDLKGGSTGVRSIGELKQMPGNPRPQYDDEDRLFNRKGIVKFEAFVTKEGSLQNFKMISSSGHRELDAKTLKALKRWKFYPGQDGLVEIPIQWDLVGGAKEVQTTLRRSTVVK